MKKTAMQLLIEDIEKNDAYFLEFGTPDSPVKRIHAKATELLETEREQIEEAYTEGVDFRNEMEVESYSGNDNDAKQYHKDTYQ